MRDVEYDRFGPWVLEITGDDTYPPLFLPFIPSEPEPIIAVKIPRNIERRNAHPGMDLYDYVILIYDDSFTVLKRVDDEVEATVFHYNDIVCIRNLQILLKGTLTIISKDSEYSFNYSSVSMELMNSLVSQIRERYSDMTPGGFSTTPEIIPQEGLSFYFYNILSLEPKENPDSKLIGWQRTQKLMTLERNRLKRFFFLILGRQLLETLHFTDGREIKIFGRGSIYKDLISPTYGKEEIFIPLDRFRGYRIDGDELDSTVIDIHLNCGGKEFHIGFTRDNPNLPDYLQNLSSLAEAWDG